MISALYANKRTNEVLEKQRLFELQRVFGAIDDAIKGGKYHISLKYCISANTRDTLKKLNYKVNIEKYSGCDFQTYISWKNVEKES